MEGMVLGVDGKALFSLIGSQMDYVDDKISAGFVFHNPNVKETCGCGMSFIL
jgi:iron-sulfur cluster assembly protein